MGPVPSAKELKECLRQPSVFARQHCKFFWPNPLTYNILLGIFMGSLRIDGTLPLGVAEQRKGEVDP
jgi:hypothetical protein